jgi:hypothetical protein
MQAKIDEVAAGIYRLSVHVSHIAPPAGFTFNHFLVRADEPMLFHCGLRGMFPVLSEAVVRLMPIDRNCSPLCVGLTRGLGIDRVARG